MKVLEKELEPRVEVDMEWASIYCALNMKPDAVIREDLAMLVPRKVAKGGKDPTCLTAKKDEKTNRWRWVRPPSVFSKEERKRVGRQHG